MNARQKTEKTLSIVIPAYNEAKRLPPTLLEIKAYLEDADVTWKDAEVIVVADGCSDDTEKVVLETRKTFSSLKLVAYGENKGKGYALKTGVAETKGDIVAFADADGATPIRELDKLAAPILAGSADVAIASRRTPDANIAEQQPIHRKLFGNAFSVAMRMILRMPFIDTQCGFKLFRGDVARELFAASECAGFAIDVELLYRAVRRNYRVKEMGVEWHDVPESKVSAMRDGMKMLLFAFSLAARGDN